MIGFEPYGTLRQHWAGRDNHKSCTLEPLDRRRVYDYELNRAGAGSGHVSHSAFRG